MITNTRIARTKARPTSSGPHHFGKDSVFFERPATTGKAEEVMNPAAVVMASGRPQFASAGLVREGGSGLMLGLVCSVAIGGVSRSLRSCLGAGRAGGGRGNRIGDRPDERDRQVMAHARDEAQLRTRDVRRRVPTALDRHEPVLLSLDDDRGHL